MAHSPFVEELTPSVRTQKKAKTQKNKKQKKTDPCRGDTYSRTHSRSGVNPLQFQVVCPPNGTAVLKGSIKGSMLTYIFAPPPKNTLRLLDLRSSVLCLSHDEKTRTGSPENQIPWAVTGVIKVIHISRKKTRWRCLS